MHENVYQTSRFSKIDFASNLTNFLPFYQISGDFPYAAWKETMQEGKWGKNERIVIMAGLAWYVWENINGKRKITHKNRDGRE